MELKFLDDVQPKHPWKRLHFVMVGVTAAIIVVAISYMIIRKNADAADSGVLENPESQLLIPNSVQSTKDTDNIFSDVAATPPNSKKSVFSQSEDWRLVLVSDSVELPKNFQPNITTYYGVNIDQRLIQPFEAMKSGAAKERESVTGVSFEPLHYRFVGKENAVAIRESGLCLEEYLAKSG